MKRPTKYFLTFSWMGWLNMLILQWFFIRLYVQYDTDHPDDSTRFGLFGFCIPLTGWWTDQIDLGKQWHFFLSGAKR